VEYLGTNYCISLTNPTGDDLSVSVPDDSFSKDPVEIGQTVFLDWKPADAHRLAN